MGNKAIDYVYLSSNTHTASGLPYFHENRAQGKAAYFINTSSLFAKKGFLGGMNTKNISPYGLKVTCDQTTNDFQRPIEMMVYYYYDSMINFNMSGDPEVFGLG